MTELVRLCPQCSSKRPSHEAICDGEFGSGKCGWLLTDEPLVSVDYVAPPRPGATPAAELQAALRCVNGHPAEAGDTLCLQCGVLIESAAPATTTEVPSDAASSPTEIGGWRIESDLPDSAQPWRRYIVTRGTGERAVLTLYDIQAEPDVSVHDLLRKMRQEHIPALLETGRWNDQAFEVTEFIRGSSLRQTGHVFAESDALRQLVEELGAALGAFSELGLRHRSISPETVLVRSLEPLDIVITRFGSARLSDFDLDSVAPLEVTRYSSPEAVVGGVSVASDWWSLGMIILEQVTRGACFTGINEKAFQIHVVTRGMSIPDEIEPNVRLLLRGLLARDPLKRWQWPEVKAWLSGVVVTAPSETMEASDEQGPTLELGDRRYFRPELYALAAAEASNWEAGKELFLRGAVATWLQERGTDAAVIATVRQLASDEGLTDDLRHALALMALNASLPLAVAGEIVTPAWLLSHPAEGYVIVTGATSRHLERMGREPWIVRLRVRAEAVRERAKLLQIELDEDRVRVATLATSRSNLEAERALLRKIYPDSDHGGLASLIEHERLPDEDLIVLISAAHQQFTPLASLLDAAAALAKQHEVATYDQAGATDLLTRSRREIYAAVERRTAAFARSPLTRVNEWADSFRVERRLPLARAAVLLAVPAEVWAEPPKQQYVAQLLEHFERRVVRSIQRGPLVRFLIGKTTPRVDMTELATGMQPAAALVDHILRRIETPVTLDPAALFASEGLQRRFRHLASHALTFRRDTGIDGRYLGFPFLLITDPRLSSTSTKPRIAPVLLWPTVIDVPAGGGNASIMFDRQREEVRLNPALEGLLGNDEFQRWREAHNSVLSRAQIRVGDVMDVFGALAAPLSRSLTSIPSKDTKLQQTNRALSCAAALFNAEFTGQAIAEDLRQLRMRPPTGTALEAALRVSPEQRNASSGALRPQDHYQFVEILRIR